MDQLLNPLTYFHQIDVGTGLNYNSPEGYKPTAHFNLIWWCCCLNRITFVTVESPAFHFWISVPVEKAFKSKELSLWSLCTVVWIQCLSLSLDLYLYFLLIYHTSEFVVGQIRSQVESVFGDPHFTGLPHLTFNPPKRTENSYTVPQALSYASQHILMFRIILSVSAYWGWILSVSAFVHLGLTICDPASHANFAFKSKHPFQIALINSY